MPPTNYEPDDSQTGWMKSSTCRAVAEEGKAAGVAYALAETASRTVASLLYRQARGRFGGENPDARAFLDSLAHAFARERLEELADRLVAATGWTDWLADRQPPPPAPTLPDYARNLEIDLEMSGPSIDTYYEATMLGTKQKQIFHLRIQKWRQPDLDRILYEESCKAERRLGSMPTVVVIFMWPPAEGPGATGRYEVKDAKGKVQQVFTYTIRRAWELSVEEAVKSVGTMILAPLCQNARPRMPEIVRMIQSNLDAAKADDKTREMVWDVVYWSMGLVCSLEEANRAMGDQLAVLQQTKNYKSAKGDAFMQAYSASMQEGPIVGTRDLILRQARRRFGENPQAEAVLNGISSIETLERIALRLFSATGWSKLTECEPATM